MDKYDSLKLDNQLCFPLYAAAKELVRRYKPILDKYNLTYTQYLVMMVLWEKKEITIKELGTKLFLDSGTLTPLVKKLEQKKYVSRIRDKDDERNLIVKITKDGENLKEMALEIPCGISKCVNLEPEEAAFLYKTLYKLLEVWREDYE